MFRAAYPMLISPSKTARKAPTGRMMAIMCITRDQKLS